MRIFKSEDGNSWIAKIHDGRDDEAGVDGRTGWEVIQFETDPPGAVQKITYRPSGWLSNASIQELIAALQEGDAVRAVWK